MHLDTSLQDIRQTIWYSSFLESVGWKSIPIPGVTEQQYLYAWKIYPTPFTLMFLNKINGAIPFLLIENIAKKNNALSIHIEPMLSSLKDGRLRSQLARQGYKTAGWSQSPTKTIRLNLNTPIEMLYGNFHHRLKYSLQFAIKHKVRIYTFSGEDLIKKRGLFDLLYLNIQQHEVEKRMLVYPKSYLFNLIKSFSENAYITFAVCNNETVACNLFLSSKTSMHWAFGSVNSNGRRLNAMSLSIWEAIQSAKKNNLVSFDLEGVSDERFEQATDDWKAFSFYKESFGGYKYSFCTPVEKSILIPVPGYYEQLINMATPKFLPGIYFMYSKKGYANAKA